MNDQSFKDRRKHVRIYRNFILSYYEQGKGDTQYEISQVNNISKGGISFVATRSYNQGTVLGISLKTPFLVDSITIEGVVLETKEKISHMIYEIRLQFNNLSGHAHDVLDKIERYSINENNT